MRTVTWLWPPALRGEGGDDAAVRLNASETRVTVASKCKTTKAANWLGSRRAFAGGRVSDTPALARRLVIS